MSTKFSKRQSGNYIELTYNSDIESLKYNSSTLCSNEAEVDALIQKINAVESCISEEISKQNLPFKTPFVILTYMNVLSSVSLGIEVRSKLSNEELAEKFVSGYKKMYDEAYSFCLKTIDLYDNGGKNESYTKYWRDYDKHNELVKKFKFELRTFKDSDFTVNLESINQAVKKMLDELIDKNKNNG